MQSESDKGDDSLAASEISDERNGPENINKINSNQNPRGHSQPDPKSMFNEN